MLKIKLSLTIIILFIIFISFSIIITSCEITNIERTSAPQIDRAYIYDRDYDGKIDAVNITFNRNIDDSSIVFTKWLFYGIPETASTGFITGSGVNDKYVTFYYDTDDLPIDTGATGAYLSFIGGDTVKDLTHIKYTEYLPESKNIKELDNANPVIALAVYHDASSDTPAELGVSKGDLVEIVFSEPINVMSPDAVNDFQVYSGNFGTDPIYYSYNGHIIVELGSGPSLTINYPGGTLGSSSGINLLNTITTTDNINDNSSNPAARRQGTGLSPDRIDIVDALYPILVKVTLRDTDYNGKVDCADFLFSEPVRDSTFVASKWQFKTGIFGTGTNTLTTANDKTVRIFTTDLSDDTTVNAASIKFLDGDTVEDMYYNKLPAIDSVTETDGAGPVILSAIASNNTSGDRVTITFSENTNKLAITESTINNVLILNNGHSWGNIASATWNSSGNILTVIFSLSGTQTIAVNDTITMGTYTVLTTTYGIADSFNNFGLANKVLTGSF